jgi:hypothetical protein
MNIIEKKKLNQHNSVWKIRCDVFHHSSYLFFPLFLLGIILLNFAADVFFCFFFFFFFFFCEKRSAFGDEFPRLPPRLLSHSKRQVKGWRLFVPSDPGYVTILFRLLSASAKKPRKFFARSAPESYFLIYQDVVIFLWRGCNDSVGWGAEFSWKRLKPSRNALHDRGHARYSFLPC